MNFKVADTIKLNADVEIEMPKSLPDAPRYFPIFCFIQLTFQQYHFQFPYFIRLFWNFLFFSWQARNTVSMNKDCLFRAQLSRSDSPKTNTRKYYVLVQAVAKVHYFNVLLKEKNAFFLLNSNWIYGQHNRSFIRSIIDSN